MKKIYLTLIAITSVIYISNAQNTFPSSGNVGIGTTNPGSLLHLVGGGVIVGSNAAATNTDGTVSIGNISRSYTPTNSNWLSESTLLLSSGSYSVLGFHHSGLRVDFIRAGNGTIQLGYDGGWGSANIGFPGSGLWTSTGNVGIGTTNPSAKLDVTGDIRWNNGTGILGSDYNGSIELGPYNSSNTTPYIDLHYGYGSIQDYNVRLINSANNRLDIVTMSNGSVFTVNGGTVGINTSDTKGYSFAVNGSAIATSVTVKLNSQWPDYVFKPTYRLNTLAYLKAYIDQNHHLPDMPSEEEVKDKGIDLGEMVKVQTKKIEELTLYLIEKDKQINELNKKVALCDQQVTKNAEQQRKIDELEAKLNTLLENLEKNK